ncbi:MAG: fimbrillin family protein, partial [Acinetobacter sp.]
MKKILYIVPLVLTALVSCQKEELFTAESDVVTINATIGEGITLSRVNTSDPAATSWAIGDKIAINNEGNNYVNYTYSGTSWAAAPGEFLKWSSPSMTFNGYYPVTEGTSLSDFVLPTDQTDVAKISAADYMTVSESKSKPASGSDVALNFTRKTARVIVKITKIQNEFVGTPVISNFKIASARARYSGGATAGNTTAVATYKAVDNKYIALVIPNSGLSGDFITLDVTDDTGSTKSLKLSYIPATEAGKSYTYNLTVGKSRIELGSSVTVENWTARDVIPAGEAIYECDEWDGTYATSFASGAGTKESPYLINTAEELALMSTVYYSETAPTNRANGYYKLMTDVDLKHLDWTPIGSGSVGGVISSEGSFTGAFDGNGHTITGLKVTANNTVTYVGLFGLVAPGHNDQTVPSIENLIIKDAEIYAGTTVTGDAKGFQGAGILVGHISRTSSTDGDHIAKIKNCHVTGAIHQVGGTTAKYVGGLAGYVQVSEIKNCSANVTIDTKASQVGGLLGYVFGSSVENSRSKGSIIGNFTLGGFVGGAENIQSGAEWNYMTIKDCTTSVNVTALDWNVGGFIGYMNATIIGCSASGNVNSTLNTDSHFYKTGGFVGTNFGFAQNCTYSG